MPVDFFEGQRQVNNWSVKINIVRKSTVFRRTVGACFVLAIYVAIGHAIEDYFKVTMPFKFGEATLLGGVLSLLLVIRTNSAYDRWWEGRKLWGALVNHCRNLTLKIKNMVDAPEEEKLQASEWVVSFPYCLKDHLRGGPTAETLEHLPQPLPDDVSHVPSHISSKLFCRLKTWRSEGRVDKFDYHLIDQHISALMDICGACERIRNTPPPLSHRALIPQLLIIYLVIAPLGVEPTWSSALLGLGIAYFLIGIEVVAEELEEPFGQDTDDLPLDTISRNIKRSVREIIRI